MSALARRLEAQFAASVQIGAMGLRDDAAIAPPGPRNAAVLIAVTDRARPGILLTERPHSMASHAGQVSFPGGKWEPGEDAVAAALREAREELAVPPHEVQVIGQVGAFNTGSGYRLTGVLGVIPPDLPLMPDPREVDSVFHVPFSYLMDAANHRIDSAEFNGRSRRFYAIPYGEHYIWGATAGMLKNLHERLCRP